MKFRYHSVGFKLISAIKVGGISSNSVKDLENEKKVSIDWNVDIERIISELNLAIDLLCDCDYFKYLMSWKQSIMSLMGNSVALEFATLVYKNWISLGRPTKGTPKVKDFQKNAVILCDRLIYEYSSRLWAGSGDSRLARDLQSPGERFKIVSLDDWNSIIDDMANGAGAAIQKGIIYHYYCLKKMMPQLEGVPDAKYEIDHIYAQAQFGSVKTVDPSLMESLGNKALLPKAENISKSDRAINTFRNETWLFSMVLKYTGISEADVDKYSNIVNVQSLINERIADYKSVFKNDRDSLFNSSHV